MADHSLSLCIETAAEEEDPRTQLLRKLGLGSRLRLRHYQSPVGNIRQLGEHGETVLHRAAAGGQIELVQSILTLFKYEVDADAKDAALMTPLIWVGTGPEAHGGTSHCTRRRLPTVPSPSDLLCLSSNVSSSMFPLQATVNSRGDVVRYLAGYQRVNVDHADNYLMTALHWAASLGHVEVAAILVKRGADVELRDMHGRTPLIVAVIQGGFAMVQYLLEKGAADVFYDRQVQRETFLAGTLAVTYS